MHHVSSEENNDLYSRWLYKLILEKYHIKALSLYSDDGRLWYFIK